jgi:hypothetical protein
MWSGGGACHAIVTLLYQWPYARTVRLQNNRVQIKPGPTETGAIKTVGRGILHRND